MNLLAEWHYAIFWNTSGCCSAIRNSDFAGPRGSRLPCSQSWTVRALTPIKLAKADCDRFNLARISFGCEGSLRTRVTRLALPSLKALISFIPSNISKPILLSVNFDFLNMCPGIVSCSPFE